jgi:hypothetical protein
MDLILRSGRVDSHPEPLDIGIADGRIAASGLDLEEAQPCD